MYKNIIFNILDRIEDRTKLMINEIPELKDYMRKWQDGKLKDIYFKEILNKYVDELNSK